MASYYFWLALFFLIPILSCAVVALLVPDDAGGAAKIGFSKKPLMTDGEREIYEHLSRALPEFVIFPKPAMKALVSPRQSLGKNSARSSRRKLSSHNAGFAVCDRESLEVLALVYAGGSLDGTLESRAESERIARSAGYHVLLCASGDTAHIQQAADEIRRLRSIPRMEKGELVAGGSSGAASPQAGSVPA